MEVVPVKQRISQQRIPVDGACEEWIKRVDVALREAEFTNIKIAAHDVHADYDNGKAHGTITIKVHSADDLRCTLHLTIVGRRQSRRNFRHDPTRVVSDAFTRRLFEVTP